MFPKIARAHLVGVVLSALGGGAALISFVSDFAQVSQTLIGRLIIAFVIVGIVVYLGNFVYKNLYQAYNELISKVDNIQHIVEQFVKDSKDKVINEKIDHDMVYRTVATKNVIRLGNSMTIKNIEFKQEGSETKVEVVISEGYNHGIRDGMMFAVFYRDKMYLMGSCACTAGLEQSSFVFSFPPNCPIGLEELKPDKLEIKPIIPDGIAKTNNFLAELLYTLEHH